MTLPSDNAFNGWMGEDMWAADHTYPEDVELGNRAADHMLLLWACEHGLISIGAACILELAEILWLNGVQDRLIYERDAFGCPILPQDLRDKLRELYIAAAKDLPHTGE